MSSDVSIREVGTVAHELLPVPVSITDDMVDYLGHVTASAHLEIFEHARWRWFSALWRDDEPSYVLARQELDYERELLVHDGPIEVTIAVESLGQRSVTIRETISSDAARIHTRSRAVLVRWDRASRRSMAFELHEHAGLERLAAAARL
jgi:acyl-CoA thioesterase FadM